MREIATCVPAVPLTENGNSKIPANLERSVREQRNEFRARGYLFRLCCAYIARFAEPARWRGGHRGLPDQSRVAFRDRARQGLHALRARECRLSRASRRPFLPERARTLYAACR